MGAEYSGRSVVGVECITGSVVEATNLALDRLCVMDLRCKPRIKPSITPLSFCFNHH